MSDEPMWRSFLPVWKQTNLSFENIAMISCLPNVLPTEDLYLSWPEHTEDKDALCHPVVAADNDDTRVQLSQPLSELLQFAQTGLVGISQDNHHLLLDCCWCDQCCFIRHGLASATSDAIVCVEPEILVKPIRNSTTVVIKQEELEVPLGVPDLPLPLPESVPVPVSLPLPIPILRRPANNKSNRKKVMTKRNRVKKVTKEQKLPGSTGCRAVQWYDEHTVKYLKSVFYNVFSKTDRLSREQRRQVQQHTGMHPRKITYWFSNHKRRYRQSLQNFVQTQRSVGWVKTYDDFLHWRQLQGLPNEN
ncbi:hypothetical protein DFQ28_011723 [Apophysomyces sp. BC1034]|nr:hypothetical protein DFQ30_000226 [Apophysomyces sp. BC1015]KAG0176760.1 hypothetical protein DFQ29_005666 [Apophysomyces sp. BC1021]KAG0184127.1 hypothetical protein DFQ28_011723 [Apophysomyces sp. BC1034]